MFNDLGCQHQLVNGKPSVASITAIGEYSVTHPSATQFFLAGAIPAAAGDVIIATGRHQVAAGIPAPFTNLLTSNADGTMWAGYRILNAGEAGTLQDVAPGSANWVIHQVVFRPNIPLTNLIITAAQISGPTDGQPNNIVVPQMPAPAAVYCYFQSSGALSAGLSPAADFRTTAGISNVAMDIKVFNGSPSAVTCTENDTGSSNCMIAGAISFV